VESGWTHSIAKHPDYANKLGIVAAEWSGLEFHLCTLFGILLGVDSHRAEAVFFTLTNNRARREAIASLVTLLLPDGNELRSQADRILRRVRNAANRRNGLMHDTWTFGAEPGSGSTISFDRKSAALRSVPQEIKELDQMISQLRILRKDIHTLLVRIKDFLLSAVPSP
jgi:hypothetical protein